MTNSQITCGRCGSLQPLAVLLVLTTGIAGYVRDAAAATGFEMYGAESVALGAFYSVDVSDGSLTSPGNTDDFLSGMDASPSGVLYATSSTLKEVDPNTGLTSGNTAFTFNGGPGADLISGLAISPGGDVFGIGNGNGNLWQIDLNTAVAQFIGSSGESMFALEFGPADTLYGAGQDFWEINPLTGGASFIGTVNDEGEVAALVTALDFAADGVMYAATNDITDDSLYTINLNTGEGTVIGPTQGDILSLASISESMNGGGAIPEPSSLTLVSIALLGLLTRRRRRSR